MTSDCDCLTIKKTTPKVKAQIVGMIMAGIY